MNHLLALGTKTVKAFAENEVAIPTWVSASFPIIRIVLFCIIAVAAIIMIVAVLFQSEDAGNTTAITGGQDTYYSQNRNTSKDGRLKIITIVMGITIFVCAILYFITILPFGGLE